MVSIANHETVIKFPGGQKRSPQRQAGTGRSGQAVASKVKPSGPISLKQKLFIAIHSKTFPPALPDLKDLINKLCFIMNYRSD